MAAAVAASAAACGSAPTQEVIRPVPVAPRWTRTPPPSAPATPISPPPAKVTGRRLANGLRVVIVEHHRRPIVSIRTVFGQGAAQDGVYGPGSTFFAVSLLAGFYEVDDNEERIIEADSFARKLFYLGGGVTVDVGADHALFGVDGYAKDTAQYLDMLSGAIRRPRCGPNSFLQTRNAMINSLEEVELSDSAVFQLFIERAAFGTGHPYARPVFGSIDTLKKLSLLKIKDRQKALLTPVGTTLLIVGDVYPGPTLSAVRRSFGPWTRRAPPRSSRIRPPSTRGSPRVQLIPRSPAASMAVCAARPLTGVRSDRAGLEVLAHVLGGGLDSRLGDALRMVNGVSYSMNAAILERRYADALVACTLVRAKDTTRALTIFRQVLERLVAAPPTAKELARAKRQIIVLEESQHTSVQGSLSSWMTALSLGKRRPVPTRGVNAVTAAQVHDLAKRILDPSRVRFLLGGRAKYAREAARAAGLGTPQTVRLDL